MKGSQFCLACLATVLIASSSGNADIIGLPQQQFSVDTNKRPIKKAIELLKTGTIEEAKAWLANQFATSPNQPHSDIICAQILKTLGRDREARQVLNSLAAREPNRFDIRLVFCEMAIADSRWFDGLIHAVAAENAPPPRNWDAERIGQFRHSLSLMKAACCEGCNDWNTAKQIYVAAAAVDDANADIFGAIGRCEFWLQNYSEARKQFLVAFSKDKTLDVADHVMARLFAAAGQPQQAAQYYLAAIQDADITGQIRARQAFAEWLLHNNHPQDIATVLARPFENLMLDQQRRLTLAKGDRMQRKFDSATKTLSSLHQEYPTDFQIGNQFALVLIESPKEALRSRALQIAETNVRNHSDFSEASSTLGWIQFKLGDIESAKKNMSRGMSTGVVSRDTAWQMAQLHKHVGNTTAAAELTRASKSAKGPFFAGPFFAGSE